MKIGEVAWEAEVTTSRIRFYEANRLIPPAARLANGYRSYEARTVKIIRFIEQAQRLGFSLKEIGAFLAAPPHLASAPAALIPRLRAKLDEVDAHLEAVRQRRTELLMMIDQLAATDEKASQH